MAVYNNRFYGDTLEYLDLTKEMDEHFRGYADIDQVSDLSSKSLRPNVYIGVTFVLEFCILVAVVVLEYFIRWTDIFPVYIRTFSCFDDEISQGSHNGGLDQFAYNMQVPVEMIYALCFCVPPFMILIGEISVWAFTHQPQKMIPALCKHFILPQVVRRVIRFTGVFLFGGFALLLFIDVIKFMTGRLRPDFLGVCDLNVTLCRDNSFQADASMCLATDKWKLRQARLAFPSMHAALASYASIFMGFYIHASVKSNCLKLIQPFAVLTILMAALLCGLSRIALKQSHWTDVVVGYVLGIIFALYMVLVVLNRFCEHFVTRSVRAQLYDIQLEQKEMHDMIKNDHEKMSSSFANPLIIPRAHLRTTPSVISENNHTSVRASATATTPAAAASASQYHRHSPAHASHM